ncbi:hypothetical protein DFJ74DRAFT_769352 [Hyaloraphidium curvatum]|nr:hypothetical protein DFJ74DRAFT_769352 [Hyaloraphidium curvatum]
MSAPGRSERYDELMARAKAKMDEIKRARGSAPPSPPPRSRPPSPSLARSTSDPVVTEPANGLPGLRVPPEVASPPARVSPYNPAFGGVQVLPAAGGAGARPGKDEARVARDEADDAAEALRRLEIAKAREELEALRRQEEELLKKARERREREEREAADRARREADARARREAEERAKREAEERARKEAEERYRRETEERLRKEAEERVRRETEERRRREAEEAARLEAARQEAARQEAARQEAARQEAARQEAARRDAENRIRMLELERARMEEEAQRRAAQAGEDESVDVAFLFDCTGSMQVWIDRCKATVSQVLSRIRTSYPGARLRTAFVGYRDFSPPAFRSSYALEDFCPPERLEAQLGKVTALGGEDAAEDAIGGLDLVPKLSWASRTKLVIHVADAPPHGQRFHDFPVGPKYDRYAAGPDPAGRRPEDMEAVLAAIVAKGIDMYFFKVHKCTRKYEHEVDAILRGMRSRLTVVSLLDGNQDPAAFLDGVLGAAVNSMRAYRAPAPYAGGGGAAPYAGGGGQAPYAGGGRGGGYGQAAYGGYAQGGYR